MTVLPELNHEARQVLAMACAWRDGRNATFALRGVSAELMQLRQRLDDDALANAIDSYWRMA
ncbi:hypothetical protein LXA47_10335 [Massilia sp. P8910]|uniref:Uncharacterized protein n=1 Tax=Massilia antarctica TaxID=2765360 RepID=A0AA48WD41_9BURK|nr:hypothetical protein [Massilia antarctica]MCE3604000.1 hypothetical protein [Massilia antarctica]QPI50445.1 hypothetical protein IV454_02135 [Massilia antarctica]